MNRRTFGQITLGSVAATTLPRIGLGADPRAGFLRMAYVADGNVGTDKDDWVSGPESLALIGKAGRQANLVHFSANCNYDAGASSAMTEACKTAYDDWDHKCPFYSSPSIQAIEQLAAQISASGPTNKLAIVGAGPMAFIFDALSMSVNHQHVAIVTHSRWNNTTGEPDLEDIEREFDLYDVFKLPDQNQRLNTGSNLVPWDWQRTHSDPRVKFLYAQKQKIRRGDTSDSGMVYACLKGNPQPTIADYRKFFGA